MKRYKLELSQQEVNQMTSLFNIAIKSTGLVGDNDVIARNLLSKIKEVMEPVLNIENGSN